VLFTGSGCFAQTDSLSNPYIQKFPDKISTQLFVLNTSNDFTLDYKNEGITIDVEPNRKTTMGIAVQYDIIFFSLGFAPKFFSDNKDNKDSKMTSFGFSLFPKQWLIHFDYIYQKGMTLKTEEANVYLPGLKSKKLGGSVAYVFNKNFSVNALAFQSERQLKSAGTFMTGLSCYYTELKGDAADNIEGKTYFVDVALSPGYSYNWVIAKKFLVAGGISIGAGFTKTVDEDVDSTTVLTQATINLSLGYNSETFYGGVLSKGIASTHNTNNNVTMGDNISYVTAFFGYRFDAPGVVTKEKNKIKNKYNL
jgi:hypothetical protein